MDIVFDAVAAERLLQQMEIYCSGIQKETKELLAILKDHGQWNDNQMQAFQANIIDIAKDLNQALALEGDYMRTFYQRVQELRG
jgi:hypothetical protein